MEKHSESFYKIFRHEGLKFGWAHAKKDFWFFFQIILLVGVVNTLPNLIIHIAGGAADEMSPLNVVLSIVFSLVSLILAFGMIKIFLHFAHEKKARISDLWDHNRRRFARWFLAQIIVGFLTMIGIILLIIPGIFVAARLYLYKYFVVDQDMTSIEAISASWELTKGHVWEIIGIKILSFGLFILGLIPIGIGLLWVIPMISLAEARLYKKLTTHAHHVE